MSTRLERLLHDALHDAGANVAPSPDLFDRVRTSIDADRARRRTRRRGAAIAAAALAAAAALVFITVYRQGEPHMDWWILEIITFAVLVAIAAGWRLTHRLDFGAPPAEWTPVATAGAMSGRASGAALAPLARRDGVD